MKIVARLVISLLHIFLIHQSCLSFITQADIMEKKRSDGTSQKIILFGDRHLNIEDPKDCPPEYKQTVIDHASNEQAAIINGAKTLNAFVMAEDMANSRCKAFGFTKPGHWLGGTWQISSFLKNLTKQCEALKIQHKNVENRFDALSADRIIIVSLIFMLDLIITDKILDKFLRPLYLHIIPQKWHSSLAIGTIPLIALASKLNPKLRTIFIVFSKYFGLSVLQQTLPLITRKPCNVIGHFSKNYKKYLLVPLLLAAPPLYSAYSQYIESKKKITTDKNINDHINSSHVYQFEPQLPSFSITAWQVDAEILTTLKNNEDKDNIFVCAGLSHTGVIKSFLAKNGYAETSTWRNNNLSQQRFVALGNPLNVQSFITSATNP